MSFGRPPTFSTFQCVLHQLMTDECKNVMQEYFSCLKANQNNNGACRHLSKAYLSCRMDHQLMEREDFTNLGFGDVREHKNDPGEAPPPPSEPGPQSRML